MSIRGAYCDLPVVLVLYLGATLGCNSTSALDGSGGEGLSSAEGGATTDSTDSNVGEADLASEGQGEVEPDPSEPSGVAPDDPPDTQPAEPPDSQSAEPSDTQSAEPPDTTPVAQAELSDVALPDFSVADVNSESARAGQFISPRDYLGAVSAWYYGHST